MEEKKKYIKELLNAYKSEVDNFNDAIFEDKFDALTTDIVKLFAIPVISGSLPDKYCSKCGEPLARKKHKFWCDFNNDR